MVRTNRIFVSRFALNRIRQPPTRDLRMPARSVNGADSRGSNGSSVSGTTRPRMRCSVGLSSRSRIFSASWAMRTRYGRLPHSTWLGTLSPLPKTAFWYEQLSNSDSLFAFHFLFYFQYVTRRRGRLKSGFLGSHSLKLRNFLGAFLLTGRVSAASVSQTFSI